MYYDDDFFTLQNSLTFHPCLLYTVQEVLMPQGIINSDHNFNVHVSYLCFSINEIETNVVSIWQHFLPSNQKIYCTLH
jgi:hypothetical protein